jgi:hypothetical protein
MDEFSSMYCTHKHTHTNKQTNTHTHTHIGENPKYFYYALELPSVGSAQFDDIVYSLG